jgi:hypothetical protein
VSDDSLRDLLLQLSPSARDKLRTILIRDDRDEDRRRTAALRRRQWRRVGRRDRHAHDVPDVGRRAVRLLAEMDAV